MAILETENTLLNIFLNPNSCLAQINRGSPVLDLTSATTALPSAVTPINYSEVRMGISATAALLATVGSSLPGKVPGEMTVESIKMTNIIFTGTTDIYSGDLQITLSPNTLVRSLKPITLSGVVFTVNPPLNAATIKNCGPPAATCTVVNTGWNTVSTATCPPGTKLSGASCDMYRGGDGREVGPRTCQPTGNSVQCSEGNTGTCRAHAICC